MGQIEEVNYSPGEGGTAPDDSVASRVKGTIPIQIDAGYRVTPNLLLGVFFQYAVGLVNKDDRPFCSQVSCSAHDLSFGVQAHYHLLPEASVDPWFGAGLGYETLTLTETGADRINPLLPPESTFNYKGFQFVTLQAGADLKTTSRFGLGPFASFAIGQYNAWSSSNGPVESSGSTGGAFHEWLTLGVRGQFDL